MRSIIFFCLIFYVCAQMKGISDNYKDDLTNLPYQCLYNNSYRSVFLGSPLIRNDININPKQYLAIIENKLNVELNLKVRTEANVENSERPEVILNRINQRLLAFNMTDPQHIWIDVDSLEVDDNTVEWVRQYLSDFSDYAANLNWTIGYFVDRQSWLIFTGQWLLPSSKNQLLWDKDSIAFDKYIPYGGWNVTTVILDITQDEKCGTHKIDISYDSTSLSSRVPVSLGNRTSTTKVPINPTTAPSKSTMAPSNSTLTPSNSTMVPSSSTMSPSNSTIVPSNSTMSPSNSTMVPSSSTISSSNSTIVTKLPPTAATVVTSKTSSVTNPKPQSTTVRYETSTKSCSYFNAMLSFIITLVVLERLSC